MPSYGGLCHWLYPFNRHPIVQLAIVAQLNLRVQEQSVFAHLLINSTLFIENEEGIQTSLAALLDSARIVWPTFLHLVGFWLFLTPALPSKQVLLVRRPVSKQLADREDCAPCSLRNWHSTTCSPLSHSVATWVAETGPECIYILKYALPAFPLYY